MSSLLLNHANSSLTLEESLIKINQELELHPENVAARQALYETMQQMLRRDAFLAYQNETNDHYIIRTYDEFQFLHPKDRAIPEIFPRPELTPAQKAINLLIWSLAGLIPAGLGTMVIAPLAMFAAIKILLQKNPLNERRRAWVVLGTAIVLWLIALLFLTILIIHLG